MKNKDDCSTKKAILNVVLDLMKEEGIKGVTIRKIAKLAGVNVALVNYYFGSKENLINEAIQVLVTSLKDSFIIFDDFTLTPKERIKGFLLQYLKTVRQYPFIVQILLQENLTLFNSQLEYLQFLNAIGLEKFRNSIKEISGEEDPKKITVMISHLLGATFLPTLVEPLYEKVTGYPFSDIETQIDILIEQYFHS